MLDTGHVITRLVSGNLNLIFVISVCYLLFLIFSLT